MQQKRIQTLVNWPSSSSSGILFLYVFSISISNKIVYFLCGSHTNCEKKESINMNGRQSGKKKKRILFKIERKKKLLWPESQPMMMMNVTHPLLTNV